MNDNWKKIKSMIDWLNKVWGEEKSSGWAKHTSREVAFIVADGVHDKDSDDIG